MCRMHGGSSPQARESARRRKVEAQATVLYESLWDPSAAPVSSPVEALAAMAGKGMHALDVLGARASTGELDGPAGVAWLRVMREVRQMLEGLERLDLDQKRVHLAEQQGRLLASIVNAILDQLELTTEQRTLARVVVPAEFRRAAAGEVVAGEVTSG